MGPTSDNGARTHPRARECEISLLVPWKAPVGVLGNEAISVASKTQLSAFEAVSGLWCLPVLSESWGPDLHAAKQALAYAVTETVHGKSAADKAQVAAQAAFGGGTGDLVPTYSVTATSLAAGRRIVDLLHAAGLAVPKSVARRLVEQGGARLGECKVTSVDDLVRPDEIAPDGTLLHAGKKHLRRIVID